MYILVVKTHVAVFLRNSIYGAVDLDLSFSFIVQFWMPYCSAALANVLLYICGLACFWTSENLTGKSR